MSKKNIWRSALLHRNLFWWFFAVCKMWIFAVVLMKIQAVLVVGAFSLTGGHSCPNVAVEWVPPVAVSCNTLHKTWAVRTDCYRSQLMEITTISHKLLCFRCLHMFTTASECVFWGENVSKMNTNGQIRSTGLRKTQKRFFFGWATDKYQTLLICCESYTKIWTTK